MFFFTYTAAALAILIAGSAAFLFFRTRRTALINAFILELITAALWIGANAAADVATSDPTLIFWSGIAHITGLFMLSFFLYFVDVFIDAKAPSIVRLVAYFGPAAVLSLFSFSSYAVVAAIYPENMPAQIVPGVLYQIYLVILIVATTYGVLRLMRHAFRSRGVIRRQAVHLMIGFSAFFLGAIVFNLVLPIMGELRFFNVGPQLSIIFCIASAYAVFKHQLLDIRIWVQRGIIYSTIFACILVAYAGVLFIFQWLLDLAGGTSAHISIGIVLLLAVFTIPYLERFFRKVTDHLFFKDAYDYSLTLEDLSRTLNTTVEPGPLLERSLTILVESLRLEGAEFRKSPDGFVMHVGFDAAEKSPTTVCVPVFLGDEELGQLCLGEKRSGDPIAPEDTALLRTYVSQLAVALKKADLYQELKDYSLDLEKKVAERTAFLERNQRHQRQMIEDASHELQTPLAIIKTTAELLMCEGKHSDIQSDLHVIDRSVDTLSHLVSGFLHLARLETENGRIKHVPFDLSALVKEVVEYTGVICRDADIDFVTTIEGDISVLGRKELIEEVVTNLLSNAVKYTRDAGERRVHLILRKTTEHIEIVVEDTGMGLALEDIPHLFKRFYRGRTQGGATKGTGLGLAICKRITKQHGGHLLAESAGIGRGATFAMQLPLERLISE